MSYCKDGCGNTAARIAALTAERDAALEMHGEELATLQKDLATERAAREKAEKEAAQYKLWLDETSKSHDATNAHLERAERERDEHAKHRANLDRKNQELSRENERLVDYASGCQRERDTALARVKEIEAEVPQQAEQARLRRLVRELLLASGAEADVDAGRDPVDAMRSLKQTLNEQGDEICRLDARLRVLREEWDAKNETLREECDLWSQDKVASDAALTRSREAHGRTIKRCTAAESALASARELLAQWLRSFPHLRSARLGVRTEEWLTSHPAPVAAHCQECVELGACPAEAERLFEESGDDEPEEDTESLIEQLDEALCSLLHTGGEIGEHSPRTHLDLFYAKQAESPVAAPCAGCTSARTAITEALRLYAGGHEHGDVLRAWLKEHP